MNINDDYLDTTYLDSEEALQHLSQLNSENHLTGLTDTLDEEVEFGQWELENFGMGF
jgi:hypothetical protein